MSVLRVLRMSFEKPMNCNFLLPSNTAKTVASVPSGTSGRIRPCGAEQHCLEGEILYWVQCGGGWSLSAMQPTCTSAMQPHLYVQDVAELKLLQ